MRPNLTLNLGLRWSYFGPMNSKENNLDVVRYGYGSAFLSGVNIKLGGNLYTTQKWNFGPQIGFAWLPAESNNNLVVRGGFGINDNQDEIAILANGIGNPPNAVQKSFCCSTPTKNAPGILYQTARSRRQQSETGPAQTSGPSRSDTLRAGGTDAWPLEAVTHLL